MNFVNAPFSRLKSSAPVPLGLFVALGMALISSAQQQPSVPLELGNPDRIITLRADSQEKDKNIDRFRGHVEVTYRGMKLTADEVTYDGASGEVVGAGHVLFIDPRTHIAADEVHYNIRTQKGWFSNGHGFLHSNVHSPPKVLYTENPYYIQGDRSRVLYTENPFYIQGEEIERLDENTYTVKHGRFTTCDCEAKGWSFSASEAKVELDDKVVARGSVIRFLGVPLFYLPFMGNSIARKPRHTGFLLPHIGTSSQKGTVVGAGFFWAISPSMDLLLGLEDYSLRGLARRAQFRATPSDSTKLRVDYFGVNDKDKVRANRAPGQSVKAVGDAEDFFDGFRGVADVDYVSSLAFREVYSPTFTEAVNSEARQIGFVTKDFGAYNFNIYASRYEDFLSTQLVPGNAVIIRQTPEFSFYGTDKQVGESPFYFSFGTSAGALGRTEPGLELPSLSERLEFHPEVTLRVNEFWGFHLTPSAGVEATRYGTSLGASHDPLTRLLGDFSLDLRPPSLEKVLAWSLWGRRLKHVIEPDIVYRLVKARDPEELANVVRYDDLDILSQTNEVEYSLTNIILARKDVPAGTTDTPQAQELISWRISQKYYFDSTFGGVLGPNNPIVWEPTLSLTGFHFIPGRRLSPVVSDLKLAPFSFYDTELKLDLSPNGQGILDAGITSHVRHGVYGLAFTDFYINKNTYANLLSGSTSSPSTTTTSTSSYHLLNLLATYGDFNRKGLSGAFGVDYNLVQKIAAGAVGQLSYNFGCFGINVEYQRFSLGTIRQENVFRMAISLANIGTFGDFKPRDRLY
ncbi:MAG: LPS assembly protein LptD [Terriglobia bacterium]|jgi:LPS-assembly protein